MLDTRSSPRVFVRWGFQITTLPGAGEIAKRERKSRIRKKRNAAKVAGAGIRAAMRTAASDAKLLPRPPTADSALGVLAVHQRDGFHSQRNRLGEIYLSMKLARIFFLFGALHERGDTRTMSRRIPQREANREAQHSRMLLFQLG